jgi:hypothetical protein
MQLRHAALGVLLGLVIVGGVQLYGDSTPGSTDAPGVNFSESPKEIAKDALRNLRRADHTMKTARYEDGKWVNQLVKKYEASDWEVVTTYNWSEQRVRYHNREMAWYIVGDGNAKRHRRGALESFSEEKPYNPETLDGANVTIFNENETMVVLEVKGSKHDSFGGLDAGDGRYFINKTTGNIDYIVFDNDFVEVVDVRPVRHEIYNYDETDVEPPSAVPTYDLETIGWDLLYGPIFPL